MATLEDLRRKIDAATDLGSVATTMKTLAAVSIRQYEQAADALADYHRTIELGFRIALRRHVPRVEADDDAGTVGAVVFGTDQGMCGQFNEEIVAYVQAHKRQSPDRRPWALLVVGSRAEGQLLEAGLSVDDAYQVPTSASDITNLVLELLPRIDRWRTESHVSQLLVFHNRRTSVSSYAPRRTAMLPIDAEQLRQWREEPWASNSLPTYVSERRHLLSRLVRQHIFVSLFRASAESLASENASRIAAMQAAEKNIEERLENLRTEFNQLRQTQITQELLDVAAGFEALVGRVV